MTIVVGYIPNKFGEAALKAGIAEARRRETDLVIVNATRGDALIDSSFLGREAMGDLSKQLGSLDIEAKVKQAIDPDVAGEIIRIAREVGASMIVIGLRHRTPVGKMLMGSVAQRVLLEADCPVLAVKA